MDPALISKEYLAQLEKKNPEFTEKDFMVDMDVARFYPQGIKNRDIASEVLKNKTLVPNQSPWGEL